MAAQTAAGDLVKQFRDSGFEVVESVKQAESLEVRKNNCTQALARSSNGLWEPQGPPYFLVRGIPCELEDRGYQKFWYRDGKRFPIRLSDLTTLHRFVEEVRYVLGFKSLYNESLGSVCSRTVYDRLHGKPER